MKTKKKYILIALLVIFIATIFIAINSSDNSSKKKEVFGNTKKACEILNPIFAYNALNSGPITKSEKLTSNENYKNITITACTYTPEQVADGTQAKSASIIVRTPTNKNGVSLNKDNFNDSKNGNETVKGIKDDAYWDQSNGQLNIYKSNTWYTLKIGSEQASDRTLEETKSLAITLNTFL